MLRILHENGSIVRSLDILAGIEYTLGDNYRLRREERL